MSLKFLLQTFNEEVEKPTKKRKEEISLAGILQRERLRLKRRKSPRPTSLNFSPSTLVFGYCKRLKVAQLAGLVELYFEEPTPKLELRFDIGSAIHKIIQKYFWDIGLLEGEFHCIKCNKTWWDKSPTTCPFVKSHEKWHLKYREVPLVLKDNGYQIKGRADGILVLPIKKTERRDLLEIKSIQNRTNNSSDRQVCFEDLDEPKADHVLQLMIYMLISGIHHGHILYVAINSNQIKSFYVEYNERLLDPIWDVITEIAWWAEKVKEGTKPLPEPCERTNCTCSAIQSILPS